MQHKINLFFIVILFSIFACQSEESSEKSISEIRDEDLIGNAAIIRSPVSANQSIDTVNVAKMTFEETVYDFGTVEAGEIVTHTFEFTNTGKVALLLQDVRSTCGCTVPEWSEDLIYPGDSGTIKVRFDTKNMRNQQKKPVTITANTYPAKTKLYLNGMVLEPQEI